MASSIFRRNSERRAALQEIADTTIAAIDKGSFVLNGVVHDIQQKTKDSKRRTRYFAPDSLLSTWFSPRTSISPTTRSAQTEISILEISTLDGARYLVTNPRGSSKIGILNFASAKKPGGGFLSGAQAQEESIARSSNLYPTLMTSTSQNFYTLHNHDSNDGFYSHAMIYSPGVVVFRDDDGRWVEPLEVDVLTSPAVNAGVVRKFLRGKLAPDATEKKIEKIMRGRMGRILFLFEKEGVKDIILGSFGTGVFQNNVGVVARIWADLLCVPGARFKHSFDRVVFAILGRRTFTEFEDSFKDQIMEKIDTSQTLRRT